MATAARKSVRIMKICRGYPNADSTYSPILKRGIKISRHIKQKTASYLQFEKVGSSFLFVCYFVTLGGRLWVSEGAQVKLNTCRLLQVNNPIYTSLAA